MHVATLATIDRTPIPALEPLFPIAKVVAITSLSKHTIYREIAGGRFPRPIELTRGRVAWRASAIADWLAAKEAPAI